MASSSSPDADAIAGIALMADLPFDLLKEAGAMARMRRIARGTVIFAQGEPAGRAHALLSGCVRITQAGSDGEEILIRLIGPNEIFGCVPMVTDGLYPADATVMLDSVEISWDPADLLGLMQRHSAIAINMVAILGKRIGETQERLRELATQSADRRIARTVLRLIEQAGEPTETGIRIGFPLRRKDIADIAGTTLHTASRIVADWERRGLLSSRKRQLVIPSPEDIAQIAETPDR